MGNASEAVKAIADHVTLDVEHGGLAKAIEQFLL
jgi:hydroxymethylpyrimidine pyrophosphatase-like HAD family hydrolase